MFKLLCSHTILFIFIKSYQILSKIFIYYYFILNEGYCRSMENYTLRLNYSFYVSVIYRSKNISESTPLKTY